MRLVEKGVINPDKIYSHRREEIQQADEEAQAELKRRVEEDKKIQAAEMEAKNKNDGKTGEGGEKA